MRLNERLSSRLPKAEKTLDIAEFQHILNKTYGWIPIDDFFGSDTDIDINVDNWLGIKSGRIKTGFVNLFRIRKRGMPPAMISNLLEEVKKDIEKPERKSIPVVVMGYSKKIKKGMI